jgi:hypothetical protein
VPSASEINFFDDTFIQILKVYYNSDQEERSQGELKAKLGGAGKDILPLFGAV